MTERICGVDEVGRGPLAGPVVAAAVILDARCPIVGLRDSKQLTPHRREALAAEIRANAVAWALGRAEVEEIDCINILEASLLAMQRAVAALAVVPTLIRVDGNRLPAALPCTAQAVVGGDRTVAAISAASVLAKVSRDAEMCAWEAHLPDYGFARHKGYPTAQHLAALSELGASPIHRRSFAPVRRVLSKNT